MRAPRDPFAGDDLAFRRLWTPSSSSWTQKVCPLGLDAHLRPSDIRIVGATVAVGGVACLICDPAASLGFDGDGLDDPCRASQQVA